MASVLDPYLIQIPSLDAAVVVNDFFFLEKTRQRQSLPKGVHK